MEFDYDKFLAELQAKELSKEEAAQAVYQEIRDAENQKAGFLDQATENPDFFTYIGSQVDSYITYLKVLHNEFTPQEHSAPDEQVYRPDMDVINRTLELVQYLEKVEQDKLGTKELTTQKTNLNMTSADI
ncbi:hypothetical protein [Pontibacter sp. HSC-36F09]|uniref:hypothetical protein n=1 Tax=Pontibacter sp. HSC-36F09 TaxID=2910966 RepID=UPI0020A0D73E|nr:hypothetical protein [Pontibacter sp. HSC-36F09]MCP2043871.1 hypothetical protein [Pontibacter sp. HSC-36F09]